MRTGKTNRSELRTGNEPKIQPEKHREPQFAIQFELPTPATHYVSVFSPALWALEGTKPERYAYGGAGPSLERLYGSPKVDRVSIVGGSDR